MRQRRSTLYAGHVHHTRLRPVRRDFRYRVYYLLLDLEEIERLDAELRWFSWERFNLLSMHARDHGPDDGTSLRGWAVSQLQRAGISGDVVGRIQLLAFPRVLGYVFNPLSIWYCRDRDGDLIAVIHEVRNTFGDKHSYVVPMAGTRAHRFHKALHVSPLMPMDQEYRFTMNDPGRRLAVGIRQYDTAGELFRAGLRATRLPLDDRHLIGVFLTHPLVTLKAITAIHWEALRTWLRGVPYHPRPDPASDPVSVVHPSAPAGRR